MKCALAACNVEFTPEKPTQKFCSRAHYFESRKGVPRPDLIKRERRVCLVCGKTYEVGGRTGRLRSSRFCSRRCAADARWRTGSVAKELRPTDAAYLAGMVDGEGSIMLYRRGTGSSLRLSVSNTNSLIHDWCFAHTGVGAQVSFPGKQANHKTSRWWACNSQAAESVIQQIEPFLVLKQEQARLALDFMRRLRIPADKADKVWQEEYRLRMVALNKRGPVEVLATLALEVASIA